MSIPSHSLPRRQVRMFIDDDEKKSEPPPSSISGVNVVATKVHIPPTPYEHAVLSRHIYRDVKIGDPVLTQGVPMNFLTPTSTQSYQTYFIPTGLTPQTNQNVQNVANLYLPISNPNSHTPTHTYPIFIPTNLTPQIGQNVQNVANNSFFMPKLSRGASTNNHSTPFLKQINSFIPNQNSQSYSSVALPSSNVFLPYNALYMNQNAYPHSRYNPHYCDNKTSFVANRYPHSCSRRG